STHVRLLLNAGNETTTSLLSNLTFRLLEQPGLYERVAHDRSLLAPAIEESLRLDAPLQVLIRRANHDEVVGETLLRGGDVIALSTLSGNRDEEAWGEAADEFDVERFLGPTPAHMGFGVGIHHCVGAYLARQTTMAGLNALLDAIPSMQLEEGYEYENVSYHIFHRPRRLPRTFAARPCPTGPSSSSEPAPPAVSWPIGSRRMRAPGCCCSRPDVETPAPSSTSPPACSRSAPPTRGATA